MTAPTVLVKTVDWNGFTHDAPVKVTAERVLGKRGHTYFYRQHVINTDTKAEWVEVYGGTGNRWGFHAFRVEEVALIPPKKRRRRKNA